MKVFITIDGCGSECLEGSSFTLTEHDIWCEAETDECIGIAFAKKDLISLEVIVNENNSSVSGL